MHQYESEKLYRVGLLDALRGFSVLSMIGFHLCYDLVVLQGISLPWFSGVFQDLWRASIAWVFIVLAGISVGFSRSNLTRALKYTTLAEILTLVTVLAAVDTPIWFGILHCLAACTFIAYAMRACGIVCKGWTDALILFVLFIVLLPLPTGSIGVASFQIQLPAAWYEQPYLFWLGLPSRSFTSGDYYPLLPYLALYLCGTALATNVKKLLTPLHTPAIFKPLEFIGRHALIIYLVHQPLLLGALWCCSL